MKKEKTVPSASVRLQSANVCISIIAGGASEEFAEGSAEVFRVGIAKVDGNHFN